MADAAALYFLFSNRTAANGVVGTGAIAAVLTVVTAGSIKTDLKGRTV
ncbi:hypothetical protein [Streptomyces sp. NPDC008240]